MKDIAIAIAGGAVVLTGLYFLNKKFGFVDIGNKSATQYHECYHTNTQQCHRDGTFEVAKTRYINDTRISVGWRQHDNQVNGVIAIRLAFGLVYHYEYASSSDVIFTNCAMDTNGDIYTVGYYRIDDQTGGIIIKLNIESGEQLKPIRIGQIPDASDFLNLSIRNDEIIALGNCNGDDTKIITVVFDSNLNVIEVYKK